MRTHRKIIIPIATLFSAVLLWTMSITAFAVDSGSVREAYEKTGAYLYEQGEPEVGSVGGEWLVLGLARSDFNLPDEYCEAYYEKTAEYVGNHMDENNHLDPNKSTEHSRIILALTSLGYNPTDIAGYDLTEAYGDFEFVKRQGINGPIWTLIALDCGDYDVPEDDDAASKTTRAELLRYIIDNRCSGGGWAFSGDVADTDMTAMAIQALAPYYEEDADAKAAVDEGLGVLSQMQEDSGGYYSYGSYNSESVAQVIVALTSLGIDPQEDERFIKNGNTLVDALMSFYEPTGGFHHIMEMDTDGMATEQAYYALVAYDRLMDGNTSLYDMSDVSGISSGKVYIWVAVGLAALAALIICLIYRGKSHRMC